jgi:hypothetical protein
VGYSPISVNPVVCKCKFIQNEGYLYAHGTCTYFLPLNTSASPPCETGRLVESISIS